MTDSVRILFHYMKMGFRDAILGTFKIYQMDKDQQMIKETKSSPMARQEQMSTLALRRAERMKHKQVKTSE